MQGGEMIQEHGSWGKEITVRDWADAWPFQAHPIVPFLLVVGDLEVASMLAGDENVVNYALHAVAALRSTVLAFWALITASRADKIPLRALKEATTNFRLRIMCPTRIKTRIC